MLQWNHFYVKRSSIYYLEYTEYIIYYATRLLKIKGFQSDIIIVQYIFILYYIGFLRTYNSFKGFYDFNSEWQAEQQFQ